jgi:hypothetical protein
MPLAHTFLPAGVLVIALLLGGIGMSGSPAAGGSTGKPLDIFLVLDNSGSMKQNDPQGLLREVASTFALKLPPEARLGIVGFDEKVRLELGLTETRAAAFKDQVAQSLLRIDYRGKWTDIPAGVERALYELRERWRPEAERVLVVLTDGMVDLGSPARNLERARWLRDDLAREARRLGVRLFGIAFTEAADFELMQSIGQATGGGYFRVLAAVDIPETFERITARLAELSRDAAAATAGPAPAVDWRPWALAGIALLLLGAVAILMVRRSGPRADRLEMPAATLRPAGDNPGSQAHRVVKAVTRIGRDRRHNDIVIDRDTVSAQHAQIVYRDGVFYLRDLRSTNGTFVNGKQISHPKELREVILRSRDRIRFESCEYEFVLDDMAEAAQTRLAV